MRRVFLAFAALAGMAMAEPEPAGEPVVTPPTGYIEIPALDPETGMPTDPPSTRTIPVVIGDNGQLKPKNPGDTIPGDGTMENQNALSALTTALTAANNAAQALYFAQRALEVAASIEPCDCDGSGDGGGGKLGGGPIDAIDSASFSGTTLTIKAPKIGFGYVELDKTIGLVHKGSAEATVTLAKIAGSNKVTDTDDWESEKTAIETAYTEADEKVTEDLTNLILSYHPPEEGVPDDATNILAKVAFDGDYNSLTNKPTIKVEDDGEGNITLSLVTGESGDDSLALHLIATSGYLTDANDWPDLDDRITALEDHVASCQCNGGGGGGGGEGCTCDGCGGGGCTCANDNKQCDCQIKTAADVRDAEQDPEAIPRVEALEERVTKLEADMQQASTRIAVLEQHVGKMATVGILPKPENLN